MMRRNWDPLGYLICVPIVLNRPTANSRSQVVGSRVELVTGGRVDDRQPSSSDSNVPAVQPAGEALLVTTVSRPVKRTVRLGIPQKVARPISWVIKIFSGLVVVLAVAVGVGYFRLSQGPISMTFLAKPIERSLNRELSGMSLAVQDAVLRKRKSGGIEFRLANVVLSDAGGVPVALAPLAAIEISGLALMRGRLAASRIDLIGSRLLVQQRPDGALTLQFSKQTVQKLSQVQPAAAGKPSIAKRATAKPLQTANGGAVSTPVLLERIDLAKALADASARARRRKDASSYLKALGLRDTTIIFSRGGVRSLWRVPDFDIGFHHAQAHSIIHSKAVIESDQGPWTLAMRSEDSEQTKTVVLNGEVANLVPRAIAKALPQLAMLEALDMPVSGKTRVRLNTDGKVMGGEILLSLQAGMLRLPWLKGLPLAIDSGSLKLQYDSRTRSLQVVRSKLSWGKSHVTITGSVVPAPKQYGRDVWKFDFKVVDGLLVGSEPQPESLPIRAGLITGWITPSIGRIQLGQLYLNAGSAEVAIAADVVDVNGVPRARLEGRLGAMSLATLKSLWPVALAPRSRKFVAEHLVKGQISGGTFKVSTADEGLSGQQIESGAATMSLTLKGTDLGVLLVPGKAASGGNLLRAPRALLHIEGDALDVAIPKATIEPRSGRAINLKALRFTATKIRSAEAFGELEFRTEGRARDVVSVVKELKLPVAQLTGITPSQIGGTFKGKLKLGAPLTGSPDPSAVKAVGQIKLRGGRLKLADSRLKVAGVALDIDLASDAVNVAGQMLVNGVVAKLQWQRILGEPASRQPPLRIVADLDDADRAQLGINLNHLVSGTVGVEVTMAGGGEADSVNKNNPLNMQVRVDLTNADLHLSSIAWKKPAGRRAILEFVARKGTIYPYELQDLRLVGNDIAIDGWVALDSEYEAREFYFPEFSVNVVTRLELQGKLSKGNIWSIKAKGSTFDGRDLFSSFFDIEGRHHRRKDARKNVPGINLTAAIDNVIGYGDVSLRDLKLTLTERDDKLRSIEAVGKLDGKGRLTVTMAHKPKAKRVLFAETGQAGKAFKMVGFYPNIRKGRATLKVNLDGKGAAETTGQLEVRKFTILGDRVVSEVLQTVDPSRPTIAKGRRHRRRYAREKFKFDRLSVPFSIGQGQFVMSDSSIKGPLIGASIRGKVDFKAKRINLGGTYVPLNGLNSAFCQIPVLGQILTGPRCEGILGITFAIQGKLSDPEVLVNPLSMLTPGIFRGLMELTVQNPKIGSSSSRKSHRKKRRSSRYRRKGAGAAKPEVIGGWSAETTKDGGVKRR